MVGFTDEWVFCLPVRLVQRELGVGMGGKVTEGSPATMLHIDLQTDDDVSSSGFILYAENEAT